jgi:hypothetical protein
MNSFPLAINTIKVAFGKRASTICFPAIAERAGTGKEKESQRHNPKRLGDQRVVEVNSAGAVRTREHPQNKKHQKCGMPSFADALLAITLSSSRTEAATSTCSMEIIGLSL